MNHNKDKEFEIKSTKLKDDVSKMNYFKYLQLKSELKRKVDDLDCRLIENNKNIKKCKYITTPKKLSKRFKTGMVFTSTALATLGGGIAMLGELSPIDVFKSIYVVGSFPICGAVGYVAGRGINKIIESNIVPNALTSIRNKYLKSEHNRLSQQYEQQKQLLEIAKSEGRYK